MNKKKKKLEYEINIYVTIKTHCYIFRNINFQINGYLSNVQKLNNFDA